MNDAIGQACTEGFNEQAFLSGFDLKTSSQWNVSEFPPLWGGRARFAHASVVVVSVAKTPQEDASCGLTCYPVIVVVGGFCRRPAADNHANDDSNSSVIVWDSLLHQWRRGPSLEDHEQRSDLCAVVCNGSLFAIGGRDCLTFLDTMERIPLSAFGSDWKTTTTASLSAENSSLCQESRQESYNERNKTWKTVHGRLSSPRVGCAAVAVHNRYIVVMGGCNEDMQPLATTDIIDTKGTSYADSGGERNENKTSLALVIDSGPVMNYGRCRLGAAVVDDLIFVVGGGGGGSENGESLTGMVECISFEAHRALHNTECRLDNYDHSDSVSGGSSTGVFSLSSSWTIRDDLQLDTHRWGSAVSRVGKCLVIAGGNNDNDAFKSVQVLDPHRGVVWSLPDLTVTRQWCSMVYLPSTLWLSSSFSSSYSSYLRSWNHQDRLLVLGGCSESGEGLSAVESLSLNILSTPQSCLERMARQIQRLLKSQQALVLRMVFAEFSEEYHPNVLHAMYKIPYEKDRQELMRLQRMWRSILFGYLTKRKSDRGKGEDNPVANLLEVHWRERRRNNQNKENYHYHFCGNTLSPHEPLQLQIHIPWKVREVTPPCPRLYVLSSFKQASTTKGNAMFGRFRRHRKNDADASRLMLHIVSADNLFEVRPSVVLNEKDTSWWESVLPALIVSLFLVQYHVRSKMGIDVDVSTWLIQRLDVRDDDNEENIDRQCRIVVDMEKDLSLRRRAVPKNDLLRTLQQKLYHHMTMLGDSRIEWSTILEEAMRLCSEAIMKLNHVTANA